MSLFGEEAHRLAKEALRGDLEAARKLLGTLWQYNGIPAIRYIAYAYVYQIAMNTLIDVSRECMLCGGKCCREGPLIPLYSFDLEELKQRLGSDVLRLLFKHGDEYYLPRPCPFQESWRCRIHNFKPYACLSYPFATEDEQIESIRRFEHEPKDIPDVNVPQHCLAGRKVKELIDKEIDEIRKRLSRAPTPQELLEHLVQRFRR